MTRESDEWRATEDRSWAIDSLFFRPELAAFEWAEAWLRDRADGYDCCIEGEGLKALPDEPLGVPGRCSLRDGAFLGGRGVAVTWNVFGFGASGKIWITGFSWKYWGAVIWWKESKGNGWIENS